MNSHILTRVSEIQTALKTPPMQGKNMVAPFHILSDVHPPFRILENTEVSNASEIHMTEGDLWQCIEGEVDFICGGSLVDQVEVPGHDGREFQGSGVEGGENFVLQAGDWLWIPPGVAHQHGSIKTARLIIIKIAGGK